MELDRTLLDRMLPAEPADPSWSDVLQRAERGRRRRTRRAGAVVALAALVVGVTSAFGGRIAHLFQGEPAPPSVQERVRQMATPDPVLELMGQESSQVIAERTHGLIRLETKAGPFFLWGAPMTHGGQCIVLTFGRLDADQPVATGNCLDQSAAKHPEIVAGDNAELPGTGIVRVEYGLVPEGAASVELHLSDGKTIAAPLVERAFLVELPRGTRVHDVAARDAAGIVVGRERLMFPRPKGCCPKIASPPDDAYRPLFKVKTSVGDITFLTAAGYPNCYSVQMPVVDGHSSGGGTCRSAGPFFGIVEVGITSLTGGVEGQLVITGKVRNDVESIELRFTDGTALPLELHSRYFLALLPRGKHPTEFIAHDANGKELSQSFGAPSAKRRR